MKKVIDIRSIQGGTSYINIGNTSPCTWASDEFGVGTVSGIRFGASAGCTYQDIAPVYFA